MSLGAHDPFADVIAWSPDEAEAWTGALRLRAGGADQRLLRAKIVTLADLTAGNQVAEIGCGTGALLVELARAVGPTGRATGYEPQPVLAAAARDELSRASLADWAKVVPAGAPIIDLAPDSLDAVVEQTVFIHLPQPVIEQTLATAVPALRPGGRWVSADQDGDTWIIDHPDRELTRRIIAFNSDYRYADGWTGRRLHRLLSAAGLCDIRVEVLVHVDTEAGSYLHGMAIRIADSARTEGAISIEEYQRWLAGLTAGDGPGEFYSSINYYVATGRRASDG